ncbi:MAG TPA: site-specific DNA-methyltransferase [Terriglobales bacterium]|nr:site-specific DNA-methyltransferase [Terriglobales bacterium]
MHTYLTYLRDRFTAARDLLTDSGSVFVQIGEENVHRVRELLDEIFGAENFFSLITLKKLSPLGTGGMANVADYVLWYAKKKDVVKFRPIFVDKKPGSESRYNWVEEAVGVRRRLTADEEVHLDELPDDWRFFAQQGMLSAGYTPTCIYSFVLLGKTIDPNAKGWSWKTNRDGMERLVKADRLMPAGRLPYLVAYHADNPVMTMNNMWLDSGSASTSYEKIYVVQTSTRQVQKCILMTTDPGDLVLDPTCGSGTTATVAEQWGRRWITIDTSRVALALARARIMGARYPYYLLADSAEGLRKEAEVSGRVFSDRPTHRNVRHGFVYERVPHITLRSIATNAAIDVISEEHQPKVRAALDALNSALRGHKTPFRVSTGGREGNDVRFDAPAEATFTMPSGEVVSASALVEWEVPREPETPWPGETEELFHSLRGQQRREQPDPVRIHELLAAINHNLKRNYELDTLPDRPADPWPEDARQAHEEFWKARITRQQAIDASIAAKADFELLYDRPYVDPKTVRVAGPFTVESLSPHRTLGVDENDELIDPLGVKENSPPYGQTFEQMILDNLRAAGVQQAHKTDRITFTSMTPWPGQMVCAEGRFREGDSDKEKRAAVFIGPEFGTVSRPDLVQAAREAGDAGFDVLIACAFNYEAHASEFSKLGRIPVLKARMNADLHMGGELKPTGKGNLFVVFGEPDIEVLHEGDGRLMVHVKGVDVFDPTTGEVRSDGAEGIACWFIDTDYNEESFFVRHAYFLGQNDPYGALKTTLKAEIDADVWATLNSEVSRPFPVPKSGRIAVKVINHLGDEVMKVFRVE